MPETPVTILWKRLDVEGHDACRLVAADDGWRLCGKAVFVESGEICALSYEVRCDEGWTTLSAEVRGFAGGRALSLDIRRDAAGCWTLGGAVQQGVAGMVDLDLGFTPATNLVAIRRFGLAAGAETPAPAAYLAFPEIELRRLDQTYRRLDAHRYRYASPAYRYDAVLDVAETGFVRDYPGLWRAVG